MESKLLNILKEKISAIRIRVKLQPAAGEGSKIQPPTFIADKDNDLPYIQELRVTKNPKNEVSRVSAIILDTIQSQSNRMELALLKAKLEGNSK